MGKIILNRPQSLNALNLQMCIAIHQQLTQWLEQRSIKAVIITGAGERAFCAGGDVRAVYELCAKQGRYDEAMVFFQQEYAMNQAIFQFSKTLCFIFRWHYYGRRRRPVDSWFTSVATERLSLGDAGNANWFFSRCWHGLSFNSIARSIWEII